MNPAIFLDRDGVINFSKILRGKPYAPNYYKNFKIFSNTEKCLNKIKNMGFLTIVITNQPDIGNKKTSYLEINKMHDKLYSLKTIDKIYVCPHSQSENCVCRKPSPYFFFLAKDEFNIDMKKSWMIGDRYTDIQAGNAAGLKTIFIDRIYKESLFKKISCKKVNSLIEAVKYIENYYINDGSKC